MSRLIQWAKRPVPLNFRTAVFCFLEGAALSLPASLALVPIRNFEPPDEISEIVPGIAFMALFLLPLWSYWGLKKGNGLRIFGLATFVIVFLLGLMFPALR